MSEFEVPGLWPPGMEPREGVMTVRIPRIAGKHTFTVKIEDEQTVSVTDYVVNDPTN